MTKEEKRKNSIMIAVKKALGRKKVCFSPYMLQYLEEAIDVRYWYDIVVTTDASQACEELTLNRGSRITLPLSLSPNSEEGCDDMVERGVYGDFSSGIVYRYWKKRKDGSMRKIDEDVEEAPDFSPFQPFIFIKQTRLYTIRYPGQVRVNEKITYKIVIYCPHNCLV